MPLLFSQYTDKCDGFYAHHTNVSYVSLVSPTTTEPTTPYMEVTQKECYGTLQSCSMSYTYGEQHDAADWALHYSNRTCKIQQSMLSVSKTACL